MPRPDRAKLEQRIDRRSLLKASASTAVTAIAGCSGDSESGESSGEEGGDNSSGTGDETSAGVVDRVQTSDMTNASPSDAQFNPYNPTSKIVDEWATYPLYDRYLRYLPDSDEYVTRIVSDYEFDGEQVTLEIGGHGHTWHDGDPVTAEDIYTQLKLWDYVGQEIWSLLDEIKVIDEQTLRLHTDGKVNEDVLLQNLIWFSGNVKSDVFGEKLKELENAGSDDEESQLVSELIDWRLEETVGTGPFKFVETNPEALIAERYEDYPWADNINYSGYKALPYNEDSVRVQALQSGELSGVSFFVIDKQTQEQLPENIKRFDVSDFGGYALHFNHSNTHLQKRKVRQAIAHVINRANIVSNIGGQAAGNSPSEYPCGVMGGNLFDRVIGEPDGYNSYGPDSTNTEKATALLEEAGYQKNGDSWVGPNGKKLSFELIGPTWNVMATGCETITSQLNRFGINIELSILEPSTYEERYQTGNYELSYRWWGGGAQRPDPYFSFVLPFSEGNLRKLLNYPEETEVPWPPKEASGTKTVNVEDLLTEAATVSGEKSNQKLQELAWIYNQDLPNLCITDRFMTQWHDTSRWNFPEDQNPDTGRVIENDDPNMNVQQPYEWLPRKGMLEADPDA